LAEPLKRFLLTQAEARFTLTISAAGKTMPLPFV
jgi:hypothetical protein